MKRLVWLSMGFLVICGMTAACDQPRRSVDVDQLRQLYANRNYKELGDQLKSMSATDQAFALPVSAGYFLNNPDHLTSREVLYSVQKIVDSNLEDPYVKIDPYAVSVAKTYEFLAKENNGLSVNWSSACNVPPTAINSCACRQSLLQKQIPKIDATDAGPELDRSFWVAESGAQNCKQSDYPFQIFAAVISLEMSKEFDASILARAAGSASQRNASKANFLLCALRRHYTNYSRSRLRMAEVKDVFSCPTAIAQ